MAHVPLRVIIHSASNLRKADFMGLSDPYVVLAIPGKNWTKVQTRVIEQNLDPVWDEAFDIHEFQPDTDSLEFKVFDKDFALKAATVGDDPLGSLVLRAADFYPRGRRDEFPLREAGKGGEHAVIRLTIEVLDADVQYSSGSGMPPTATHGPTDVKYSSVNRVPPTETYGPGDFLPTKTMQEGMQASRDHMPMSHSHMPRDDVMQFGGGVQRIRVTIVSAKDLRDADWMTGSSDPYVVCEVPGKLHTKFKTEVVEKCLNPVWNKSCDFDFTPGDSLEFNVYDKDIWPKPDDFLGKAVLPSERFMPYGFEGNLQLEEDHTPQNKQRRVVPKLLVQVQVLGKAAGSLEAQPPNGGQIERWRPQTHPYERHGLTNYAMGPPQYSGQPCRLKVAIVQARGVITADARGRSDFYCICEIPGRPSSRIQTRGSGHTADPVWNHEQEIREYIAGDGLEFTMLDMDMSRGGFAGYPSDAACVIGTCTMACEQFYPYGYNSEVTLSTPGQGIRGLLRVKIVVIDDSTGAPTVPMIMDQDYGRVRRQSNLPMLMDRYDGPVGRQSNVPMLMDRHDGLVGRQASPLQSARRSLGGQRMAVPYAQQVDRPLPLQAQPVHQRLLDDRLLNNQRYHDVYPSPLSQHQAVPLIRDLDREEMMRRRAGYVRQASPIRMDGGMHPGYMHGGSVSLDAGHVRHASPIRMEGGISSNYVQGGMSTLVPASAARLSGSHYASPPRSRSMMDLPPQRYSVGEPVPVVNYAAQYPVVEGPRFVPEVIHRPAQYSALDGQRLMPEVGMSQQSLATLPRPVEPYGLSHAGLTQTLPRAAAPPMAAAPRYSNPWQRNTFV